MNIAIVSPEFPPDIGGVETYAREFVKELARRGHEVSVFTRHHVHGEEELPGVRVKPVLTLCLNADRTVLSSVRADAWHVMNAAYAWLAEDRPGCLVSVHGNDFLRPYYPIAQPDLRNAPIAWRWSREVSQYLRPLWIRLTARLVRRGLSRAHHVIANSRYTERVLVERIPACRGKTSVGYVGVAAEFFDVAWRPTPDGIPRLLTVARLSEPRKNVDSMLHALSRLQDRFPFRYTIVGDGHERGRLERLAAELGLGNRVRFAGLVTREALLDSYAQADLMVLASSVIPGSHEGFGIVYLEAAASGVPSLAARLAGAAEAVDEGKSGMYVEEPTVEALADALASFLGGQVRFDRDACRNFARRFSWGSVVDHSMQYYPASQADTGE